MRLGTHGYGTANDRHGIHGSASASANATLD